MSSVVDTRQAATVVFKVLGVVWLLRAIGDIPGLIGAVGEVVVGIGLFTSSRSLAVLWSERGRHGVKERGGNDAAP